MATTTSAGPSGISSMSSDAANDFTSTSSRMEAMSGVLAENWWAIALRGVLAILFGIIAFAAPGATILSLVLLFSAYMLVDGVFAIVAAVRAARRHERWGLLVLEGIANIAVGIIVFLWPPDSCRVRPLDGCLVDYFGRIDGRCVVPIEGGSRPRLARRRRHRVDHLWGLACHRAAHRRDRADLVARRLCVRLRRGADRARLPAQGAQGPRAFRRNGAACLGQSKNFRLQVERQPGF